MRHRWLAAMSAALILSAPITMPAQAADAGVTLFGFGLIPGDLLDKSGLKGKQICAAGNPANCIDQATFGAFGSALAYTGRDGVFIAVNDRGPFDGLTDKRYLDRFHYVRLSLKGSSFDFPSQPNIRSQLLDTRALKGRHNQNLLGNSSEFQLRFDPEGASVSGDGTVFLSDEYGPYINEFDRKGRLVRAIPVPAKFLIKNPSGQVDEAGNSLELYPQNNVSGRQANRGMEGLAITPNGRYLVGMMQNALIQDNGLNSSTPPGRRGRNSRILKIDLKTGKTWEYVYPLDAINQGRGVNDLLAINDHEFLAIERDNRSLAPTPPNAAQTPNFKKITKIDLARATDVSKVASLPETPEELAGMGITPAAKEVFIDLLDASYVVSNSPLKTIKDVIAEKVEGLAWGPDLRDGRHVLYVITDNDLNPGLPTQIYAFAIDTAKIDYKAQKIWDPMYPERDGWRDHDCGRHHSKFCH